MMQFAAIEIIIYILKAQLSMHEKFEVISVLCHNSQEPEYEIITSYPESICDHQMNIKINKQAWILHIITATAIKLVNFWHKRKS